MPTLAVGMSNARTNRHMPTASVGMAPNAGALMSKESSPVSIDATRRAAVPDADAGGK